MKHENPDFKGIKSPGLDPNDPFKISGPHDLESNPAMICVKEKQLFRAMPLAMVKAGYLKIKTKKGEMAAFELNSTQKKLIAAIESQLKKKEPVRIVILKARQLGTSTACEAILFSYATQRSFTNAMVLADDEDGAGYIYGMNEMFYDELEKEYPHLVPTKARSSEQRMEFDKTRSAIRIETANNKKAGRKYTNRFLHMSECAFYRDFTATLQGVMQSVPDLPETVALLETTANGTGEFCKFWRRIKQGKSGWIALFLSWKEHEEYTRPFYAEDQRKRFEESLTRDERFIQKTYELTLEQMNWRRYKIENDFAGDHEKFEVEFPLDDEQAFKSTAKSVFPERLTRPQDSNISKPKYVGEMQLVSNRPVFLPMEGGSLKVWDGPKAGRQYVIGADSCESALSNDDACAQVLDRKTWAQVAHVHGHIPPDQFAETLFALGLWYNNALIAPEVNGPGMVTVYKLTQMYYPNLAHRQKMAITDSGQMVETEEVGFHTNVKTKPMVVSSSVEAFRELLIVVHDEQTLDEHRTYVVKEVTKDGHIVYGADDGYKDDCVMALAIAVYHARQLPEPKEKSEEDNSIHYRSNKVTGY